MPWRVALGEQLLPEWTEMAVWLWRLLARLSALGHSHVNMLGRYAFTLPDTVTLPERIDVARRKTRSTPVRTRRGEGDPGRMPLT